MVKYRNQANRHIERSYEISIFLNVHAVAQIANWFVVVFYNYFY